MHMRNPVTSTRVIICERSRYDPLDFPMTKSMFEEIEKVFRLHPATLPTFESHAGTFSQYLDFKDEDQTKLERLCG